MAVPVGQQLRVGFCLRHLVRRQSGHEEEAGIREAGAREITDHDLVKGRRNHAHRGLAEACIEHVTKLCAGYRGLPQQRAKLTEHCIDRRHTLLERLCAVLVARRTERGYQGRDGFRSSDFLHQRFQCVHTGRYARTTLAGLRAKMQQRQDQLLTESLPLAHTTIRFRPCRVIFRSATDAGGPQDIIKPVDVLLLFRCHVRQGTQETKDRIEAEIPVDGLQCRPHELRVGRIEQARRIIKEIRDPGLRKHLINDVPVVLRIRQDDADVLVAEPIPTHGLLDAGGHRLDLLSEIRRLADHEGGVRGRLRRHGIEAVEACLNRRESRSLHEARQYRTRRPWLSGARIETVHVDRCLHRKLQIRCHLRQLRYRLP